jgi:Type VII secretion system ESX-1, transport TM domain B
VGQVFQVESQSGARQFAVAVADGLLDITQVQADLLLADNPEAIARARPLTQSEFVSAPHVGSLIPTGDDAPPATTPALSRPTPGGGVCVSFADGARPPSVSLPASLAPATGEIRVSSPAADRTTLKTGIDWVAVAPGRGAVVEALAHPGAPTGLLAFVSDLGQYHAVPTHDALAMLGYAGVRPVRLPAAVVTLLPAGRALDPAAAGQAVPRS